MAHGISMRGWILKGQKPTPAPSRDGECRALPGPVHQAGLTSLLRLESAGRWPGAVAGVGGPYLPLRHPASRQSPLGLPSTSRTVSSRHWWVCVAFV